MRSIKWCVTAAVVIGASAAASAQCPPRWADWFAGGDVVAGNPDFSVSTSTVWNRGGEQWLCIGGSFSVGSLGLSVACWNGRQWDDLGGLAQTDLIVEALSMIAFDDGTGHGEQLYVGGRFTVVPNEPYVGVMRWNGSAWEVVGSGLDSRVNCFAVYDDGAGPKLYAGGSFEAFGGFAKWDGVQWRSGGSTPGIRGDIFDLAVYEPETGPVLVIGGSFSRGPGDPGPSNLATWDGKAFGALGQPQGFITALETIPAGQAGAGLYVSGYLTGVDDVPVNRFAYFNGKEWGGTASAWSSPANSMLYVPPGEPVESGLYIAGAFTLVNGSPREFLVRHNPDNNTFEELGAGFTTQWGDWARALTLYGEGDSRGLYVGGLFREAGGVATRDLALWNGDSWSRLGNGAAWHRSMGQYLWDAPLVAAFATWDDGTGPALYAGGVFEAMGSAEGDHLARWDGAAWTSVVGDLGIDAIGDGYFGGVRALTHGPLVNDPVDALYILGQMASSAQNDQWNHALRWDGKALTPLGAGLSGGQNVNDENVLTAEIFNGELYVGGLFTTAGGGEARNIAKWDGAAWSSVGAGLDGSVNDLLVYDDGRGGGPALYASGAFRMSGARVLNGIARLGNDGWEPLGPGLTDAPANRTYGVGAMAAYDDGSGLALFALGTFTRAGTGNASILARWDGEHWSDVETEITSILWAQGWPTGPLASLCVYDDQSGAGPQLYLGGASFLLPEFQVSMLMRWDGKSLESLDSEAAGPARLIFGLHPHDDGVHGESLFVGGLFGVMGGTFSGGVAQLLPCNPCDQPCDWNGDGAIDSQDFFAFIVDFFADAADYNGDGQTTSQDFFDFLTCFFVGC